MGFECDLGIIARAIAYNCILPTCLVSINKQSSLIPSPTPSFSRSQSHSLLYRTASDEKLGVGLGMRLQTKWNGL